MPSEAILQVSDLRKTFRVPRAGNSGDDDPRRERLNRRHDLLHALRGVSFEVHRGESVGLIGYNGCGKSTMLKILAGVSQADGGSFNINGRLGALLELGAGFHPDLTGVQNVYLNGAVMGLRKTDINNLLPGMIEFSGLERFMDMPVRHYSSGMITRLGFAMATRLDPDLLLLDETFAVGDTAFQTKALAHLDQLRQAGKAMLVVSHNIGILTQLTDRIIWLVDGKIHREGPPEAITSDYVHSLQFTFREGEVHHASQGLETMFIGADPEGSMVKLGAIQMLKNDQPASGPGPLEVDNGDAVAMEYTLLHPGNERPRELWLETAWVRSDDSIQTQSRTKVTLSAGESTRLRIDYGPTRLLEAQYDIVAALAPVEGEPRPSTPEGRRYPYYDRLLHAGQVRIVTPNPYDSPMVIPLEHRWQHGSPTGQEAPTPDAPTA